MNYFKIVIVLFFISSCSHHEVYTYYGREDLKLCKRNGSYQACDGTKFYLRDKSKIILAGETWRNINYYHIVDTESDYMYCRVGDKKSKVEFTKNSTTVKIDGKVYRNPKVSEVENGFKFLVEVIASKYEENLRYEIVCSEPFNEDLLRSYN